MYRFRIENLDLTIDVIRRRRRRISRRWERVSRLVSESILFTGINILKEETPTRTGYLRTTIRGSIDLVRERDRTYYNLRIGFTGRGRQIAHYLTHGTRPSPGRYVPVLDRRLTNVGWFWRKGIGMHPGVRPNPFIRRALERLRARIPDIVMRALAWR